jgi:hypothetical protein
MFLLLALSLVTDYRSLATAFRRPAAAMNRFNRKDSDQWLVIRIYRENVFAVGCVAGR